MESTTNTATPAATATTASTQNTIVTSTVQPFPTTMRDTTRSWSTAAGSRIIHPISMNRSGRSIGSFRRNHTSTVSTRSEEHTSELQSRFDLVCRLLLEKKK